MRPSEISRTATPRKPMRSISMPAIRWPATTGAPAYVAPWAAGENEVAPAPGYAANVEVASATPAPAELPPPLDQPEQVPTPGLTTVDEVARSQRVAPSALLKAVPVMVEDRGLVLVLVRGDHRVNEIKLRNHLRADFRMAKDDEMRARIGPPGFLGPVGADVPILLDEGVDHGGYVTGANVQDCHLRGVEPGRDFAFRRADVRSVEAAEPVAAGGGPTPRA